MLCLNRKLGQSIQINDDVTITIIDIKRQSVRLGIIYGDKARVLRHEVYMKVSEENKDALLPHSLEDAPACLESVVPSPKKAVA